MNMKLAKNANIVMAFNLVDDFDHILYAVMKVSDPGLFNEAQFLRFIKTPDTYDTLSIEVLSNHGLQMAGRAQPMMGVPGNNPYMFGQFQISQGILMDNPDGRDWKAHYKLLDERIKSYGDIDNVIWFFNKEALQAHVYSQNAIYHQVLIMNHGVFEPAWFEVHSPQENQQSGPMSWTRPS